MAANSEIRLGVLAPYGHGLITNPNFLRDFALTVEVEGAESVWAVEHVVVAEDYEPNYPYSADGRMPSRAADAVPMPDPLELLTFLAASTTRLRLGTAVVVAPLHSAALLAKRAATLDVLSSGRLLLGLGIGWQKEEYAAVGAPFEGRGLRLEESVAAMRTLWGRGPSTFHGQTASFEAVHVVPKPVNGTVPIVLGGNSDAAVRRAGRLADGWFPYTIGPEKFADAASQLRDAARRAGRDPSAVEITVWPGSYDPRLEWDVEWVRQFVKAGATRLVLRLQVAKPDELTLVSEQLTRYRTEVLDRL